ncbi:signal recognition particle, SRP54 subunit protein [Artemisia annua]|uniref:signal-recognition-particle GTPase n=1 Tax=Artemisia annua TaxID=35608 RepID=A0A2U1PNI2_ARTAN|nr:signal recognition particle, SRP54 subunit protein [Artemisia annua]
MVLQELGGKISSALQQMTNATTVNQKVFDKCLNDIARALLQNDVQVEIVGDLQSNIKRIVNLDGRAEGHNKRKIIQQAVFSELCKMLDPGKPSFTPKKNEPSVVMFVGLQGSGKTTTCTKYAHYYQNKGWKPALVCADTFRAGAFDQLKQNATKANIPFYGSHTESDPVNVAVEGVETFKRENRNLIIIDTSGRHVQEKALFEEMLQLREATKPDLVIFVMDSSIGQAAFKQAQAFKQSVDVGAVIVTKMDGHAKGGGALSAVAATKSPVIFIGTGEHINEFEDFNVKPFVSRLLGIRDLSGFINQVKEVVQVDEQELMQKLLEQNFTMRIMYELFQKILEGSFNQVLSMLMPKEHENESQVKIRRYLTMMDSMTNEELGSTDLKLMKESRIMRIARGAGRQVSEVFEMFQEYKRLTISVSKMKKMVNTRHTDEFTSNPAFEAAVQRRVDAMIPNITARIAERMQSNDPGSSGGSSGGHPPTTITSWLEKFSKEKPKSFSSASSPSEAEDWLGHIEKLLEGLGCGDEFKARLATYKFEGDALNWWKSYKAAKGDDFMTTLTWAGFREIFLLHFFPVSKQEKFEHEYHNIYQYEKETSTEFMKRFLRLAGFMGARAGTQAEQAKKFKWALRNEVLEGIVNTHFDDVAQVANAVRNLEILKERAKQGVKRNYEGEPVQSGQGNGQRGSNARGGDRRGHDYRGYGRSDQGNYRSGRDYQNRDYQRGDQQNRGRHDYRTSGSYGQKGNGDRATSTPCNSCGKTHPGRQCYRAIGACFLCGDTRHMARDCPQKNGTNNNKGNGGNRQQNSQGRVHSMTRHQAANSSEQIDVELCVRGCDCYWASLKVEPNLILRIKEAQKDDDG